MAGRIVWVFVANLPGFPVVKNFENPLRIDNAMSVVYYFFGTQYTTLSYFFRTCLKSTSACAAVRFVVLRHGSLKGIKREYPYTNDGTTHNSRIEMFSVFARFLLPDIAAEF